MTNCTAPLRILEWKRGLDQLSSMLTLLVVDSLPLLRSINGMFVNECKIVNDGSGWEWYRWYPVLTFEDVRGYLFQQTCWCGILLICGHKLCTNTVSADSWLDKDDVASLQRMRIIISYAGKWQAGAWNGNAPDVVQTETTSISRKSNSIMNINSSWPNKKSVSVQLTRVIIGQYTFKQCK